MAMYIEKSVKETFNHKQFSYRFSWIHLTRPMTFTGTISPILAGTALAANKESIHLGNFIGLLIASLLVQSSANMLNDYYDFKNGQDLNKWIIRDEKDTRPSFERIPLVIILALLFACIIGLWLASRSSYWIIFVGILGITFGFLYSGGPRPLSSIGLGELTAAVFLGFVPSFLGYIVQTGMIDMKIFVAAIPYASLISSMILTNNIRDLNKDQMFRHTLAMMLGRIHASRLVTAFIFGPYLWVFGLILLQIVSWSTIMILIALPFALKLKWSLRPAASQEDKINAMKLAAFHHWTFGILFAIGIWL
ncbi:1,4-dihydroxy-2-naphthoate octaprenyltransferase [Neobacillus mesonae]|uniref:1,4-dihydroxy-2-naphthoate octaprenyltransferase n=1 Tax=Neobacillus mesonae TaxID=1193713 RepID=UPI0020402BA4|nr:1,4-dihydroxy-2-naphthoate octaprenyltransferase [Neobacillus mesonae]MCM3567621.1 1,4-dihydroxy-2-naphthoate octaprenyltransferase [Neobacillus mesonae]